MARFLCLLAAIAMPALAAGDAPDGKAPAIHATLDRAKEKRVEADSQAIAAALMMYKINNGHFPTEKQGLMALVEKPAGPPLPRRWLRLMARVPVDPWEREYRLVVRKKDGKEVHFIASQGPDPEDAADDLEQPVEKPEAKEK
jgi:general secretion pathway protein G